MGVDGDDDGDWPPVNVLVGLRSNGWEGVLPSRVEDGDPDAASLLVAAPNRPGEDAAHVLVPAADTSVRLSWTHPRGMSELRVVVESSSLRPVPRWHLRAVEPVEHIQRRDAIRVPVLINLEIRHEQFSVSGTTVDVSEGGFRCIVSGKSALEPGTKAEAVLEIGSGAVSAHVELLRWRPHHEGFMEATARFIGLGSGDANRIRKFLLAEQIAQRNRARGLA